MPSAGYRSLSPEIDALELQAEGEDLERLFRAMPLAGASAVLDVGCGSGAVTRALAARSPSCDVVGVDLSAEHVAYATAAACDAAVANVSFALGDILDEGFVAEHESRYDLVLCRYLLMYAIPRGTAPRVVANMARCARPGGSVVSVEPDVNFGEDRYPPPPEELARILRELVAYYRRHALIEWRSGIMLGAVYEQAGLPEAEIDLVDGRIVRGARPAALVEHMNYGVEELIAPCLDELGAEGATERVAAAWRSYARRTDAFVYTPVFMATAKTEVTSTSESVKEVAQCSPTRS